MVIVMPTKRYVEGWEYKRHYGSPNSFAIGELRTDEHVFSYVKRRRLQSESSYSGFRPFCKCGWKSKVWEIKKEHAQEVFNNHVKDYLENRPKLEGMT